MSNSHLTAASVKCEYELHKSCPKAMLYSIPATIFQHHNSTFNTVNDGKWTSGKTLSYQKAIGQKTYYKITIEIMAINRIEENSRVHHSQRKKSRRRYSPRILSFTEFNSI